MKFKVGYFAMLLFLISQTHTAQRISIIGSAVGGWTENVNDVDMVTTDNITYTVTNYTFRSGEIKFRENRDWTVNWGGTNFPNGIGIRNTDSNIPVIGGVYTVTFNRTNASYTFIGTAFHTIGIVGPAVNSQLGYAGPEIKMTTNDGINYTLSGFYFSSGNAYFRQDNDQAIVWGVANAFPTGTAVLIGPPLFIPGGEYFVTFNRLTGTYNFSFPSIGILGTALNGYLAEDANLNTTDGFSYSISNLVVVDGTVKFRKDDLWTSNWGANDFPTGKGFQDGPEIPVSKGTYAVNFDRITGNYVFQKTLGTAPFDFVQVKVYPNPTQTNWNFDSTHKAIDYIQLTDALGKTIRTLEPKKNNFSLDTSKLSSGIYFAKVVSNNAMHTFKLIKD
ncbi:T9SS type A sorting domain-containing protein [Flavobacterium luteum]|uniref:T9SS type A sorting domain-containing protein n=1 Tax=Flavobacterium luteum TaxID=2026654 RepID=A0A7J5AF47_9FLAO|nr:T9SS type A sorting domain-containing protein [Flavobacterium luteum]KAB1155609.1 T9SS type A sorting domain-containing protein [Flavobacterium luteum]